MLKRIISVLSISTIFAFGFVTPMTGLAEEASLNKSSVEQNVWTDSSDPNNADKESIELAKELSNYFKEDSNGNIEFTADKETLIELGISEKDAHLILSIDPNELTMEAADEVGEGDQQVYGFVGLHLKLGPKVRAMNGIVAGGFAAGFIGWHVKQIAAAGPWGAGAATAITAGTAGAVGWAVNKGLTEVNVGPNIPFVNMSYTVNIP